MEHPNEEKRKKLCRYYTSTGGCRFGAECWFFHPPSDGINEVGEDNKNKENQRSVLAPVCENIQAATTTVKHSILCKCGGKVLEASERLAVERLTNHVFESYLRMDRDHLNVLDACLAATKAPFRTLTCKVCTKWTNNKSVKLIRHYCQRAQGNSKHSEDHRNQLREFCTSTIGIFREEKTEGVGENANELSKLLADLSMKESSSNVQTAFDTLLVGDSDGGESDSDGEYGYCGFSADDVDELLCQGIKPWDPEAGAALSVLYDDFY